MISGYDEIKFKNYKSFEEFSSISQLKNINVFIGRNNCGKSSCIDVIQSLTDSKFFYRYNATIRMTKVLHDEDISRIYEWDYVKENVKRQELEIYKDKCLEFDVCKNEYRTDDGVFELKYVWQNNYIDIIEKRIIIYDIYEEFKNLKIIRLNAERDIVPEQEMEDVSLSENGAGAANLIHHILNFDENDERLVRVDLLEALNEIMYPDSVFDDITIQKVSGDKWEIFLYENDNRYALSKMGSGLKTIILVLLNLLVVPCINESKTGTQSREDVDYGKIIFAFEELENNLHPALQRRLFDYIYKFSKEHDTTVLLTTHSHVAINMFADKEETQLYHVKKENGKSSIEKVEDYITKSEILNDLDVRASDLLQSNGIIWVEGPSDKVYIKHWLEIWGDKDLVEGVDYQFLYYGGRILSHFTADPNTEDDNLIKILSTNRNAAIVIDSDKRDENAGINDTKTRIKEEFESKEMFCWITKGKEIENYVPVDAIKKAYQDKTIEDQCEQYQLFPDYIEEKLGINTFDKVKFARKVIKYIDDENSKDMLDLKTMVEDLSKRIRSWNPKC